jgi:hypothetical protein
MPKRLSMESPLLQRGEASLRWVEDGANADNAKNTAPHYEPEYQLNRTAWSDVTTNAGRRQREFEAWRPLLPNRHRY